MTNTADRTSSGFIDLQHPATVKIVGQEYGLGLDVVKNKGLGAFNVLGAWDNAGECYYYNEYINEQENVAKQNWIVDFHRPSNEARAELPERSHLKFGDQVSICNQHFDGEHLMVDGTYLSTRANDTKFPIIDDAGNDTGRIKHVYRDYPWTIEVVPDLTVDGTFLLITDSIVLKNEQLDKYVSALFQPGLLDFGQYYPTVEGAAAVNGIKFTMGNSPELPKGTPGRLYDGRVIKLHTPEPKARNKYSTLGNFSDSSYPYYWTDNYKVPEKQCWILVRVRGPGLVASGERIRLFNVFSERFLSVAEKDHRKYLYTTEDITDAGTVFIIEKAP